MEKNRRQYPFGTYDTPQEAFNYRPHGEDGLNHAASVDLYCIDEGIKPKTNAVRIAGSGIFLTDRQIDQITIERKVGNVSHHGSCGAAEKYKAEQNLHQDTNTVAAGHAQRIAQKFGAGYVHEPIVLDRPPELHTARAVYYDGTRRGYEPSRISTLPRGFGISRGVFGEEIGQHDASLAVDIALGTSGFGNRFTEKTPLYIVGIYDRQDKDINPEILQKEIYAIRDGRSSIAVSIIDIAQRRPSTTIIDLKNT